MEQTILNTTIVVGFYSVIVIIVYLHKDFITTYQLLICLVLVVPGEFFAVGL